MSSDSSSNASDTELDLSNVRRVDEKKRKWGEASGGLRETFLSLPRPQSPPPPRPSIFIESRSPKLCSLSISTKTAPNSPRSTQSTTPTRHQTNSP